MQRSDGEEAAVVEDVGHGVDVTNVDGLP